MHEIEKGKLTFHSNQTPARTRVRLSISRIIWKREKLELEKWEIFPRKRINKSEKAQAVDWVRLYTVWFANLQDFRKPETSTQGALAIVNLVQNKKKKRKFFRIFINSKPVYEDRHKNSK